VGAPADVYLVGRVLARRRKSIAVRDSCLTSASDISPFTGTDLDTTLRNLEVRSVVATGVSVNLGVLGLCVEAVNLGYSVVVPTDTVAGVPRHYAEAVMANTIALLATRVTVDDIIAVWTS
jgi:nicotinamidase-related amidase